MPFSYNISAFPLANFSSKAGLHSGGICPRSLIHKADATVKVGSQIAVLQLLQNPK